MNLRYRQSEPHPDSDAAHLGSSPHSCVGIVRRWVPREHIAEGFAVGDCNADADGITIRVNHRRQMAGGVLPVCHSLLRNPFWVHDSERCQVGAEAVGIYSHPADNSEGVLSRLFCAATVDSHFDLQLCLWYATMISKDRNADFQYDAIV